MEVLELENIKEQQSDAFKKLFKIYKKELADIESYIKQASIATNDRDKAVCFEAVGNLAMDIEHTDFRVIQVKNLCKKYNVLFKFIKPYISEVEENFSPIIFDNEQGKIIYQMGNNRTIIADDFIIELSYRLEDENENVKWIIEVRKADNSEPITLEVSNDDFSNARKMKTLFLSKRLSLIITDTQLSQLHAVLLKQDPKDAKKVIRLGYDDTTNSYVFANGVWAHERFIEPNHNAICEMDNAVISMPYFNKNDIKNSAFKYVEPDGVMDFRRWVRLFVQAHTPAVALPCVAHYLFSIYRDIVIDKIGNSPLLFLKGPAGSGKSAIAKNLLNLFGTTPKEGNINLKAKVTETSLGRILASYSNYPIWIDEYTAGHDIEQTMQASFDNTSIIKAKSKGGSYDTGNEVERLLIKASLIVTSNFFPDEEPIFTRLIYVPVTKTSRESGQESAFRALKEYEEVGMSWITCELQKYRNDVAKELLPNFYRILNRLKNNINDRNVNDRLISNQAIIQAIFGIVNDKMKFYTPDNKLVKDVEDSMLEMAIKQIKNQHETINDNSPLRVYFEILNGLYQVGILKDKRMFRLEYEANDKKTLILRFDTIYSFYKEKYMQIYKRTPPDKSTILSELARFLDVPEAILVSQQRFKTIDYSNNSEKTFGVKGCIVADYDILADKYSLDLESKSYD